MNFNKTKHNFPPNDLEGLRKYIRRYKRKYQFARRVAFHFGRDSDEFALIMKAWQTTRAVHRGKERKNGDELFSHERTIAIVIMEYLGIQDANLLSAAFLHDLVEDYDNWTYQRVLKSFNKEVADIVAAVTKPSRLPFETDASYSDRMIQKVIAGGEKAVVLKCADRLHNMLTLSGKRAAIRFKTRQTFSTIIPMAIQYDCLWRELTCATVEQISSKGFAGDLEFLPNTT